MYISHEFTSFDTSELRFDLDIHGTVKEFVWVTQNMSIAHGTSNISFSGPELFNYSDKPNTFALTGFEYGSVLDDKSSTISLTQNIQNLDVGETETKLRSFFTPEVEGIVAQENIADFDRMLMQTGFYIFNVALKAKFGKNPAASWRFEIDGQNLFKQPSSILNYLIPQANHTSIPSAGVNNWCLCVKPESEQSTGSANFSKINNAALYFVPTDSYRNSDMFSKSSHIFKMFYIRQNFLIIKNGKAVVRIR